MLVPYLGSDHDRVALRLAQRLAEQAGAWVTILHVLRPERGQERLGVEQRMQETFQTGPTLRHTEVVLRTIEHASPSEAVLAEAANDYNLVIIGAGREWGLEHRLFGLLPEAILTKSPVSVLVVRHYAAKAEPRLASRQGESQRRARVGPAG